MPAYLFKTHLPNFAADATALTKTTTIAIMRYIASQNHFSDFGGTRLKKLINALLSGGYTYLSFDVTDLGSSVLRYSVN